MVSELLSSSLPQDREQGIMEEVKTMLQKILARIEGLDSRLRMLELRRLKERGNYFEYVEAFVALVNQIELSDEDQVKMFLEGLTNPNHRLISILSPRTLQQAIAYGKTITMDVDPKATVSKESDSMSNVGGSIEEEENLHLQNNDTLQQTQDPYMLETDASEIRVGGAVDCQFWHRKLDNKCHMHEMGNVLVSYRGRDLSVGIMIVEGNEASPRLNYMDREGVRLKGTWLSVDSGFPLAYGTMDNGFRIWGSKGEPPEEWPPPGRGMGRRGNPDYVPSDQESSDPSLNVECWGAEIYQEDVEFLDVKASPWTVQSNERKVKCQTLAYATGDTSKGLWIPSGNEFFSREISAYAICEGASSLLKGQVFAVVGGGDTATEEAFYLTKYVLQVDLLVRRDQQARQDKVFNNPNITVHFITEMDIISSTKSQMSGISLKKVDAGEDSVLEAKSLFDGIGHSPNSQLLEEQVECDHSNYVLVEKGKARTSRKGVFTAGNVQDHEGRQAVIAAGSGCNAALSAERYLASNNLFIEFHQPQTEEIKKELSDRDVQGNCDMSLTKHGGQYTLRKVYHENPGQLCVLYTSPTCGPIEWEAERSNPIDENQNSEVKGIGYLYHVTGKEIYDYDWENVNVEGVNSDKELDMTKVKIDPMKPQTATKVTELLGFEDEVIISFSFVLLEGKEVNGAEVPECVSARRMAGRGDLDARKIMVQESSCVPKALTWKILFELLKLLQYMEVRKQKTKDDEIEAAVEMVGDTKQVTTLPQKCWKNQATTSQASRLKALEKEEQVIPKELSSRKNIEPILKNNEGFTQASQSTIVNPQNKYNQLDPSKKDKNVNGNEMGNELEYEMNNHTTEVKECPELTHKVQFSCLVTQKWFSDKAGYLTVVFAAGAIKVGCLMYEAENFSSMQNLTGRWVQNDAVHTIIYGGGSAKSALVVCRKSMRCDLLLLLKIRGLTRELVQWKDRGPQETTGQFLSTLQEDYLNCTLGDKGISKGRVLIQGMDAEGEEVIQEARGPLKEVLRPGNRLARAIEGKKH